MISYFLGANAPGGFYSLYDGLIDLDLARAVYILKGGPGCGKSTLMGTVARRAEAAGEPVEYILCSGDPDSLDAILLPRLQVALVDGTAPHVIEPTLPGAVEHCLNLGDCYHIEGLAPLRSELTALTAEYKACYPRAYRCLSAAADIAGDCRSLLESDGLREKMARRAKGVITRQLRQPGTGAGTMTPRFLSALTCRGSIHLWETVEAQCSQVVELEDSYGFAGAFLTPLAHAAAASGQDGILCLDPMEPNRPAHLLLPGLDLAFVSSVPGQTYPGKVHRRIRLDTMVEAETLRRLRPRLRFGRKVAAAITQEAVASLAQAKALHDQLETLYNPHVDFQKVNALAEDLCQHLGI